MNKPTQTVSTHAPETAQPPVRLFLRLSSGLALACYALAALALLTPLRSPGVEGWVEAVLLLATTAATLAALARELPAQNVAMAAAGIAVIGTIIHAAGAATGIPFGFFTYTKSIGPCFRSDFAWAMPLLWVTVILNSRGVGRLMLRPWRKVKNYGFWLIGLTVALTLVFVASLDPYAANVRHYWIWERTNLPFTWEGTPASDFLGWAVGALLIQAFVTPALIKRRPSGGKSKPDYHPLFTWVLAMILFSVAALANRLWLAGGFGVLAVAVTLIFSLRGARW
jgi:uncharacterized membrane protein